jgi:hypothetical protein
MTISTSDFKIEDHVCSLIKFDKITITTFAYLRNELLTITQLFELARVWNFFFCTHTRPRIVLSGDRASIATHSQMHLIRRGLLHHSFLGTLRRSLGDIGFYYSIFSLLFLRVVLVVNIFGIHNSPHVVSCDRTKWLIGLHRSFHHFEILLGA